MGENKMESTVFSGKVTSLVNEDLKREEVQQIYGGWAEGYDQDVLSTEYTAPLILANEVERLFGKQKNIRILDVGAGTGLVGKYLSDKGFTNMDALDGCPEMLDVARQKGYYCQLHAEHMGKDQLDIADESYGIVISCGAFIPGHLDEECYEQLIRITKKGGHIVILMKEVYFTDTPEYSQNLKPRMLELQDVGLWRIVSQKTNVPKYHGHHTGWLVVLQKC